jgi:hypothetical protein
LHIIAVASPAYLKGRKRPVDPLGLVVFDADSHPAVHAWLDRMAQLPVWRSIY